MTENAKTIIFAAVAALTGLLAYASMPRSLISDKQVVDAVISKPIFEKFTTADDATTLKIDKFDPEKLRIVPFDLAKDKKSGAWVIPSHNSYPADAASQISAVANSFIGLKILTVESTKADDQKLYGVVKPDAYKLEQGEKEFGTLVKISNDKGEELVDLVIGKTVKDDPKKRYVRRSGSDAIYTVEYDPKSLTTDFSAWIEGDLLKLSSNDVETLSIRDYAILPSSEGVGQLDKNFDAKLTFVAKDNKWTTDSIKIYGDDGDKDRTLADDEMLNSTKLTEIKNVLDNLKIVDVVRKPQGLAANLKAEKNFLDDQEKIMSLFRRGFVPGRTEEGGIELFSSSGELAVTLKDGVEYLLRFGNAAENRDIGADDESKGAVELNRTLFVTVRLDESKYPEPNSKKLPESIEELDASANTAKSNDEPMEDINFNPASDPSLKSNDSTEPSAEEPKNVPSSTQPQPQESTPSSSGSDAPSGAEGAKADEKEKQSSRNYSNRLKFVAAQAENEPSTTAGSNADANTPNSDAPTSEAPTSDAPTKGETADKPSSEASSPVAKESDSKASDGNTIEPKSVETPEEAKERLEAAREKINKENQRLIDDRKDKMDAAKKKAAELNARFADWYYEISDSDYKRLRIKLDDLIQKKTAADATAVPPAPFAPQFGLPPE